MKKVAMLAVFTAAAWAQTRPAAFEVASIKPNPNCRNDGRGGPSAGRLDLPCITPRALVRMAYGMFAGDQLNARRLEVTGGPSWLDTEQYHITAKAEGSPSGPQMMGPMMRALLEERFHLKIHVEPKETAVFAMTVAKDGPKLTPAKPGGCVPIDLNRPERPDPSQPMPKYCGLGSMRMSDGRQVAEVWGTTLDEFAGRMLSTWTGRPVIDKTGLSGRFDVRVEFTFQHAGGPVTLNGEAVPSPPAAEGAGPSIFTALQQQLGLKLSPEKMPMDIVVVDSAQRPTEN
jgi:uncharacterized protein (TIGR03435 family)